MIDPIQKHLADFRQQSRMKAGSLIISVFGDAVLPRGGRIWLGSLIGLLKPLQLNDRLIRTAIFRLVKEEWMYSEAIGRRADYMLTPAGQRRFEETARHIYASNSPLWDRRWRLILTVGELEPKQRERLRRAFFWQGFGMVGSDCFVHPSTDLTTAFDALMTEGMSDLLKHLMPLLAARAGSDLSASDADMVQRAWNLEQLGASYADFVARYQPMLDQLRRDVQGGIDDECAFLLRTLLIHDYRRLLLRDPELPDVLLPAHWPGQKARLLCKELYRRLLAPSERHIELHMKLSSGMTPGVLPMLAARFQTEDPLMAPV
ncbi:PaaX family transcriptional regulator C-terminal domain-containing protein [Rhodoferax ferrireducens]|uniref:PaaX family transcriptional regulator n=1 Tax=Rhodoferax ferrireducens TaxID=192843 RepID=UPI001E3316F4|nr:PaaX family transcriptional regulator C-terminal domain-containing protein [Rhodoferax ferrireducens]